MRSGSPVFNIERFTVMIPAQNVPSEALLSPSSSPSPSPSLPSLPILTFPHFPSLLNFISPTRHVFSCDMIFQSTCARHLVLPATPCHPRQSHKNPRPLCRHTLVNLSHPCQLTRGLYSDTSALHLGLLKEFRYTFFSYAFMLPVTD
ncbi:hypothetical protein E2C01_088352 [Portunus trituberculatus]|uniref:Uncharacterized protein n=1 Tax=Portunus trituberculatus TaxID=210409 RepID=A0A5B7JE89_PORTR|nr:hypothetical protein [Portunus trituberculatus]